MDEKNIKILENERAALIAARIDAESQLYRLNQQIGMINLLISKLTAADRPRDPRPKE